MSFAEKLEKLKNILGAVSDLRAASELLDWDMRTYMAPGSIDSRSLQLATLGEIAHEKITSREFGKLIGKLQRKAKKLDPDSDERRLIEKVYRDYEKEHRLPAEGVRRNAEACSRANSAWERAREEKNFKTFAPHLQELLDLTFERLSWFEPYEHPYDPLLDRFDEGVTCADLEPVFARLKKEQSAIIRSALEKPAPDTSFLNGSFPAAKQLKLTEEVLTRMGYDWNCGRQDSTVHPFTTTIGLYDVRVTTKVFPGKPFSALFSSVHEGGHALYEQGIDKRYARTPLGDGASFSVHESQSRLWENLVARSPEFWQFWYPRVQKLYPATLKNIPMKKFLAALNIVEASPIRVEADELTYNMHIILRFELEKAMLEGKLKVADLADAWNAGMKDLLGIERYRRRAAGCSLGNGRIRLLPLLCSRKRHLRPALERRSQGSPRNSAVHRAGRLRPAPRMAPHTRSYLRSQIQHIGNSQDRNRKRNARSRTLSQNAQTQIRLR